MTAKTIAKKRVPRVKRPGPKKAPAKQRPQKVKGRAKGVRLFISYRRDDETAAAVAGRLFDRLTAEFGEQSVFMDIDRIRSGADFVDVLRQTVATCHGLVAMIGKKWLALTDVSGRRRLDDPKDWVRIEIGTALRREIRVIPALVYGARCRSPSTCPSLSRSWQGDRL